MTRKLLVLVVVALAVLAGAPAMAQEPANVNVWIAFTDAGRLGWAQARAAEFNELFPQYNVSVEGYANYEELFSATALAAEQGSLPAVVQYFEVATQDARDSGYFTSIAEALGGRTEVNGVPVNFEDIIGPVRAYYTLDGEFTSMPWNTSSAIFFSNMTILNQAGIFTPPSTWEEVANTCAAVMALENAPEFCFTWPNHGWFFEQWLAQQNAEFANNGNGREARATEVTFNSEAGVAILEWLDEMLAAGYLYYSGAQGGASWATVDQAFGSQQVAMAAYSSSDTALYTQTGIDNGFEVVASFLPYNQETGWTGNLIGGASLWLTAGLPEDVQDGALTFLLWLSSTENDASWHQTTGYIAIRESTAALLEEQGWFEANPNFSVAANQLAQSTVTSATSGALVGAFPSIRNVVTQAIDTVLLTDRPAAEVLDEAAAAANQILAD
ncbi:extracellular solute-binding protein, partial [Anaerolineae bacterium CFX9]|nr:extracellular solute-binding protein [Anaerolineae bacterium CFX9]